VPAQPSARRPTPLEDGLWAIVVATTVLVAILALQYTKHRLILPAMKSALWVSVVGAFAGAALLLSGWGRTSEVDAAQLGLGTSANTFYHPRRESITNGGALFGGVAGALWWGASSWIVFFRGMTRGTTTNALVDFEVSVVVGALAGALIGAALGRAGGYVWERRHRGQRRPAA
jgi:hypothetical protein